ncbi:MAG: ATP-binding protein [Bacteroidota bacterium]
MKRTAEPHATLNFGLAYLEQLLAARLAFYFKREDSATIAPFRPPEDGSSLANFLSTSQLSLPEQMVLFLAMVPEVAPELLERCLKKYLSSGGDLPVFGGIRGKQHRGILPTGETAQFLLGGTARNVRLAIRELLAPMGKLRQMGVIDLLPPPPGEPPMAGQLLADPEWIERILTGSVAPPAFSPSFPAQRLKTDLDWEDLVLTRRSLNEINYLRNYLNHHEKLAGNPSFGRHQRKGYRALFHGPPGTGKTLTATLLGKAVNRPVFRVDLSMVVSKWIGETEKNLAGLFQKAEHKGWILFFDEADALFAKRGEVKESRDKYANQETSFLLQRVENYDGLCILATNFRNNLDKAFTRRFEAIVPFTPPTPEERLRLWQNMLPEGIPLAAEVDLPELAKTYELTGANIANAVRHAVYESVAANKESMEEMALLAAIRREYEKEDRLSPTL